MTQRHKVWKKIWGAVVFILMPSNLVSDKLLEMSTGNWRILRNIYSHCLYGLFTLYERWTQLIPYYWQIVSSFYYLIMIWEMQMENIKLFHQNSSSTDNSLETFSALIVSDKALIDHLTRRVLATSIKETVTVMKLEKN